MQAKQLGFYFDAGACIGCRACVRACAQLTWDAIRMVDKAEFEEKHGVTIE